MTIEEATMKVLFSGEYDNLTCEEAKEKIKELSGKATYAIAVDAETFEKMLYDEVGRILVVNQKEPTECLIYYVNATDYANTSED